jgi:diguanylate cyclase (GGDEF)-like protein
MHACPDCGAAPGTAHVHSHAPAEESRSRRIRIRAKRSRATTALLREANGSETMRTGRERDRAADLRDQGAEQRDTAAGLHDRIGDPNESMHDLVERAARDREQAAIDRTRAAEDRARAAADRELAAAERTEALQIRAESAGLLERAATDELTGARTRLFGLEEAAREVDRAERTGAQLMLAFVDVDGLKLLNDSDGHQAGDELLELVGHTLRANLRPYDVIVRFGGDEFICAMPDINSPEARARFKKIAHALSAVRARYAISFGLAQALPGESLHSLIARADADLLACRSSAKRTA